MEKITEDYVSFETAKLLKEKGFSENTICKYADVGGVTEKWYDDYRERVLRFDWEEGYLIEPSIEPKDQYEIIGDTISAPTQAMAMKWLREVHNIFISIVFCTYPTEKRVAWIPEISTFDSVFPESAVEYNSYEEATEASIKYCLKNLI